MIGRSRRSAPPPCWMSRATAPTDPLSMARTMICDDPSRLDRRGCRSGSSLSSVWAGALGPLEIAITIANRHVRVVRFAMKCHLRRDGLNGVVCQTASARHRHELGPVGRADLVEDVSDVVLDGFFADRALTRDLLVRAAGCREP